MNKKNYTYFLSMDLGEAIQKYAKETYRNKSIIVELAIKQFLIKEGIIKDEEK